MSSGWCGRRAPASISPLRPVASVSCRRRDRILYYWSWGLLVAVVSGEITSGADSYGPAGVVLALISYVAGFVVCLHLGAVFGRTWNDWRAARASVRNT
jgi:hypothetical protein